MRIAQEDFDLAQANLARLIAECSKDLERVRESQEFLSGTLNVQMALRELGHEVNLDIAVRVWVHYSNSLCAGWMSGMQTQNPRAFGLGNIARQPLKTFLDRGDGHPLMNRKTLRLMI